MTSPFEQASEAVARRVAAFVEAADRLVNLLATEPQPGASAASIHARSVNAAYDEYDRARRALTGEDVSSA